jgi:hypothetical protein
MKLKITAGVLVALVVLFSCQDDHAPLAPIIGQWKGTRAELRLKPFGLPIPISKDDDDFASTLEFKSDGTLVLTDGSTSRQGTYSMAGNKITTDLDFSMEDVSLSGTYEIEDLTDTALAFYIEKKDTTLTDPNSGKSISGDVKVTLHFQRM